MAGEKRFEKIYHDGGGFSGPATTILVDRKTGVHYLYVQQGYSGGVTPLLNRNGTPVITPIPSDHNE